MGGASCEFGVHPYPFLRSCGILGEKIAFARCVSLVEMRERRNLALDLLPEVWYGGNNHYRQAFETSDREQCIGCLRHLGIANTASNLAIASS